MKQAKTTWMQVARWLVVLTASLAVSLGSVSAATPAKSESSCAASCARQCPCCLSKSAPVNSTAPLAPPASTHTSVAKDFQLASLLNALLLKERVSDTLVPARFSTQHFSASLPVFLRHRAILL